MSWTPYAGDPYSQVGENAPPTVEGKAPERFRSRRAGMNSGLRLQASQAGPVGVSWFTPDQLYFRDSIADGRWGNRISCGPAEYARHNVNMIRRHADGTCDLVNMEADGKFYLDLGGHGARDVGIGKP